LLTFRKLLTLDEARQIISQNFQARPPQIEEVGLLKAYRRVLAEDVVAMLDIPPFNRSTVDGYALRAQNSYGAEENKPRKLKVVGRVSAGEMPKVAVKDGLAVEVATGAPIPDGADAVLMVEHTERKAGNLLVYGAVAKNENVMKAGSDVARDETVLRDGQVLGSREIGVLAALGKSAVKVFAVPRVVVFSTGTEIMEPGKKLLPARIYDINAYSLYAAVLESGAEPVYMGVFPDDMAQILKALREGLASADLVLTSGGVSVGPRDFMPEALETLGKPGVIVHGVAIKPGKPVTVASVNGKFVFSLPGHPTSALLVFHLLVRPVIERMAGREPDRALCVEAAAARRMFPAKGRRTFVMVKVKGNRLGKLVAEPVETGESGAITTFASADGYVEIGENLQFVDENERVIVHLFKNLDCSSWF
jgi:molybdenum cofactor synthesis domain-containing protein